MAAEREERYADDYSDYSDVESGYFDTDEELQQQIDEDEEDCLRALRDLVNNRPPTIVLVDEWDEEEEEDEAPAFYVDFHSFQCHCTICTDTTTSL